jgi:hypothetical protein
MTSRKKPGVAFWATVVVVVLIGCAPDQAVQTPQKQIEAKPGTQAFAEAKAIEELQRQNPGSSRRTISFSVRDENQWRITVSDKPARPGGFTTVVVSDDGTVVDVQGGE